LATTVQYNGVTFLDVLVDDISQVPVYDPSGVDYLYTQTVVKFRGIVHTTVPATIGAAVGTIGEGCRDLLLFLNTPRRNFAMSIDGSVWFDVTPGAGDKPSVGSSFFEDVNHGPKPSVTSYQIVGQKSVRIAMTVELAMPMCNKADRPPILNFRFWTADAIDCNTWLTNRAWRGRVRLRSARYNPHAFRAFVMPPLTPGFRRKTIQFSESEDALTLEFMVIDEEMFAVPPPPATHWDGHYTVNVGVGGNYYTETIYLQLSADKDISKVDLFKLAHKIFEAKTDFINRIRAADTEGEGKGNVFLETAFYRESLAHNTIEASATIKSGAGAGNDDPTNLYNVLGTRLGTLLEMDNYDYFTAYLPDPTASMTGQFLARLQSPCDPVRSLPYGTDPERPGPGSDLGQEQTGEPETQLVQRRDLPPYQDGHKSVSQQEAMYTHWQYKCSYYVDEGKIALPRTSEASDQSTVAVLEAHKPIIFREVSLHGWRIGRSPEIAKPVDFVDHNGIKHTVLSWNFAPSAPISSADAKTTKHEVSAWYRYALDRKPTGDETYAIGKVPYRAPDPINLTTFANSSFIAPGEDSPFGPTTPAEPESQQ
jgi:hypothetical protein